MYACICTARNKAAIRKLALEHAEAIRNETTLNRGTGVLFRATIDGHEHARCTKCIGEMREAIVEMGLREAEPKPEIGPCGNDCNTCSTQACRTFAP